MNTPPGRTRQATRTTITRKLARFRPTLLVGVAGLGYTGVFAVLTWQAKRGQSVIHPDQQTLVAFVAVALVTLAATTAVIVAARRRPAPSIEIEQREHVPIPAAR